MRNENRYKNILILSLFYYPDSRVGAKRFGNLVSFFSKYNKAVHVLTIPEKNIPAKDSSLLPQGVVHRVRMLPSYPIKKNNPFKRILSRLWEKHLCMLDFYSGWILPAIYKAVKIIKTEKIDLIIATAPPYTPMLVGTLASLLTGKKLILDYRDPWTTHTREFPSPFGKVINVAAERFAVRLASCAVFCSTIMKNEFLKQFGRQIKSHVLTNGYLEPDDGISPLQLVREKKVTMLYAGNLYRGRSLGLVAMALSNLMHKQVISPSNFEFIIYGQIQKTDRKIITTYELDQYISVKAPIPYHKVLRCMKGADILFLPSAEEVRYAIPYKFFDYLMVKKPILAIAPKNSAVEIAMREISCGYFCEIGDTISIEKALTDLIYNRFKGSISIVDDFCWSKIADKYLSIINKL